MRSDGAAIPKAMLPVPSPLGRRRISFTADYIWTERPTSPEPENAVQESDNLPASA
jgi:hypothetical protein